MKTARKRPVVKLDLDDRLSNMTIEALECHVFQHRLGRPQPMPRNEDGNGGFREIELVRVCDTCGTIRKSARDLYEGAIGSPRYETPDGYYVKRAPGDDRPAVSRDEKFRAWMARMLPAQYTEK